MLDANIRSVNSDLTPLSSDGPTYLESARRRRGRELWREGGAQLPPPFKKTLPSPCLGRRDGTADGYRGMGEGRGCEGPP